jgi:vacuolar iron transporter family protein
MGEPDQDDQLERQEDRSGHDSQPVPPSAPVRDPVGADALEQQNQAPASPQEQREDRERSVQIAEQDSGLEGLWLRWVEPASDGHTAILPARRGRAPIAFIGRALATLRHMDEHAPASHVHAHPERPHRNVQGGGARAAIFGVSDGLVTNVSLIIGVAGAHPGGGIVRLTGLAGLVAGSFSMAAGEYLSVNAQRELLQRELNVERAALRDTPEVEAAELRGIYERRGIDADLARDLVGEVMQDPDLALETHAREELGVNPRALGAPIQAAAFSFFAFALGALLPLLPWFVTTGGAATLASVAIGVVAALTVGTLLGVFTGRSRVRSALRQLAVTAIAAGITYGVGRAIGSGVA